MRVGDLVKVSNNGFAAIGYIKNRTSTSQYYRVQYTAILEDSYDSGAKVGTLGLWSKEYIKALKEVICESR
jgi:hypothetical protein